MLFFQSAARNLLAPFCCFAWAKIRNTLAFCPTLQVDIQPKTAEDKLRQLAIVHSHPTWLVRRWVSSYGPAGAVQLMEHNNYRPVYGVRVNLLRVPSVAALLERLQDQFGREVQAKPSQYLPDDFIQLK